MIHAYLGFKEEITATAKTHTNTEGMRTGKRFHSWGPCREFCPGKTLCNYHWLCWALTCFESSCIPASVKGQCSQMEECEWYLRGSPACSPGAFAFPWLTLCSFPDYSIWSVSKGFPGTVQRTPCSVWKLHLSTCDDIKFVYTLPIPHLLFFQLMELMPDYQVLKGLVYDISFYGFKMIAKKYKISHSLMSRWVS